MVLNDLLHGSKIVFILTWVFWGMKGEVGGEYTNDGDI